MDIHKPKPWRGFRGFLKEYLIIVVGVLTALGAEQVAEWLHWRHQAAATDERLSAEVQANMLNAYTHLVSQRCYDERLVRLSEQLRSHGHWRGAAIQKTPVPPPERIPPYIRAGILTSAAPPVYISSGGVWPDSSWSSALSSGVTLHMGQDRVARFARLYKTFATMRDLQTAEGEVGSQLSALAFDRELSDAERTHFLEEVGRLSFMNIQLATYGRTLIDSAAGAGIRLRKSEATRIVDEGRHYFLTRDCLAPVSIPLAPD